MEIPDADKAAFYLDRIGWFRFRGYANTLAPPARRPKATPPTFDDVLKLYRFDRQLRLMCLDASERIEMSLKGYVQDYLYNEYGKLWFNDPAVFSCPELPQHSQDERWRLQRDIQSRIERQPKRGWHPQAEQDFNPLSIMDRITLGDVSKLFAILPQRVMDEISNNYCKYDDDRCLGGSTLYNWFKAITLVRNWSAHHNRLWNEKFDNRLQVPGFIVAKFRPTRAPNNWKEKLYGRAIVIFYLLDRVSRNTNWHYRLDSLIRENLHDGFDMHYQMGFPVDWMRAEIWNPPRANRTKMEEEA